MKFPLQNVFKPLSILCPNEHDTLDVIFVISGGLLERKYAFHPPGVAVLSIVPSSLSSQDVEKAN